MNLMANVGPRSSVGASPGVTAVAQDSDIFKVLRIAAEGDL
jgi:hypothetical protein